MTERAGAEVETLTVRIPIRLQRRGGRKLIMTPEGVAALAWKPSRDEMLVKAARPHAPLAAQDRERSARSGTHLAHQDHIDAARLCCVAKFMVACY